MLNSIAGRWVSALLLGVAVVLAGCAETELLVHTAKTAKSQNAAPATGYYKVGNAYQIQGVWYYPKEEWDYSETGIASWYGPGFHGKSTANGEVFNENALTAAHRTLPMPSIVRVTNLDNGRSIVVRVNDRGPFAHGRIIDMSRRSAQLLGFMNKGTAKVRVELLEPESLRERAAAQGLDYVPSPDPKLPSAPAPSAAPSGSVQVAVLNAPSGARTARGTPGATAIPAPAVTASVPAARAPATDTPRPLVSRTKPEATQIYIQAGSFEDPDNAQRLTGRLGAYFQGAHVKPAEVSGKTFYRVRIGPINEVDNADRLLERVIVAGYPGARIVLD
ncbi:septal ring lytic transglycosylase RlpA family protein [Thalassobaculum sp. OXR-137]|uniref:septal ring lytic transglycosylase RlpA family protein n=1 Tax=Thalassobaculum sp. OXR-137 TaxID=3100173 RepID=UPI002AC8A373|nr:septal ring lytic transglycosylase RlpA family protein [Thalassobaculum sp. OXR-137]WPZ33145.1 septal ring lytic transglycosylase RlpA family protein [Thalassobaculum sp. OXR-137]